MVPIETPDMWPKCGADLTVYSTPTLDYSNFKVNSLLFIEMYLPGWNLTTLKMLPSLTNGEHFEINIVD